MRAKKHEIGNEQSLNILLSVVHFSCTFFSCQLALPISLKRNSKEWLSNTNPTFKWNNILPSVQANASILWPVLDATKRNERFNLIDAKGKTLPVQLALHLFSCCQYITPGEKQKLAKKLSVPHAMLKPYRSSREYRLKNACSNISK